MEKEFNLSEKIQDRKYPKPIYNTRYTYDEEDVKEFIRLLKERSFSNTCTCESCKDRPHIINVNDIDKLAGDKLK